jgi:hypothetical protein
VTINVARVITLLVIIMLTGFLESLCPGKTEAACEAAALTACGWSIRRPATQ